MLIEYLQTKVDHPNMTISFSTEVIEKLEDLLHIPDIFDMVCVVVISLAMGILAKSNEQEQRI